MVSSVDNSSPLTVSGPRLALELSGIDKRFDTIVALEGVTLGVRRGTIHAILGENGAGKTTLVRVAYGLVRPDSGTVRIREETVHLASPIDAIRSGIGMVHQHFTLVPAMTVAENLALGGSGRLRRRDMIERVEAISARTGFRLDPNARIETLSVGAQQRVEIGKALARNASLLILDEPTAVLAPLEITALLQWLRAFVAEGNAAVIITHKLREAVAVADDVTVLRQGRVEFSGPVSDTSIEQLTHAMIGPAIDVRTAPSHAGDLAGEPQFTVDRATVADGGGSVRIREASFSVFGGEIVGVAGVEGAGQQELLRVLAGRLPVMSGHLRRPPSVGFVPEDRHRDGILLDRTIAENVALAGSGSRRGVMDWSGFRRRTRELIEQFDVRTPDEQATMRGLSGGNQQKLVMARELTTADGSVVAGLVVENPTRGLDVRATAEVHARLRDAAARGAAVVLYSSDLDEVLSLAQRVLVVFDGTVREVPVDRDAIGRAMLGLQ